MSRAASSGLLLAAVAGRRLPRQPRPARTRSRPAATRPSGQPAIRGPPLRRLPRHPRRDRRRGRDRPAARRASPRRSFIAGAVPNTPANLVAWIRLPRRSSIPRTAMPTRRARRARGPQRGRLPLHACDDPRIPTDDDVTRSALRRCSGRRWRQPSAVEGRRVGAAHASNRAGRRRDRSAAAGARHPPGLAAAERRLAAAGRRLRQHAVQPARAAQARQRLQPARHHHRLDRGRRTATRGSRWS